MGTSIFSATISTPSRSLILSISVTARNQAMADSEQAKQPALHSAVAPSLLALGILVLAVSFFWPGQSVSRTAWPPEQAKAYQTASVKLHNLSQERVAT